MTATEGIVTRPSTFFQRWKWGIWFAASYLLVSVPCVVAYLLHPHEYSIPMFIVHYASFPTVYLLFEVLTPYGRQLSVWLQSEALVLAFLLLLTAAFYFALGQGLGWVFRRLAWTTGKHPLS